MDCLGNEITLTACAARSGRLLSLASIAFPLSVPTLFSVNHFYAMILKKQIVKIQGDILWNMNAE